MKIQIPRRNWPMTLASAIEASAPGDTIMVHSEDMRELALRAQKRMCPGKTLTFAVEQEDPDGWEQTE